ncbi:CatB-related O-acetyltransferase [Algiphilus sp.]|uniref:CatB-related O-acetyltransferase n=1 Tax=Algiphilus sp. TaxID=1872431 RepID=UPI0025C45C7A|nr:CatB-related O-acetyltransferase [Algiphilus sp.]MCK5770180.1 CatB-related O-acetyltransferase [Algiphilus sp.]
MEIGGPDALKRHGLSVVEGRTIKGALLYERPAFIFDPRRVKDCAVGAFTLVNGLMTTSMYRCRVGRYGQIGESVILGPPEHPQDWFSNHPFAFTRPNELPSMYEQPEFERLAPDGSEAVHYAAGVPSVTTIGHEAYIGAGAFVSRGVTIGDGAVVGARAVVTRDVPPYSIVFGSPACVRRLRFSENIVERMMKLEWWRYDLAPHKHRVDFSRVEHTLAYFEEAAADGRLATLQPDAYRVTPLDGGRFRIERVDEPLYDAAA